VYGEFCDLVVVIGEAYYRGLYENCQWTWGVYRYKDAWKYSYNTICNRSVNIYSYFHISGNINMLVYWRIHVDNTFGDQRGTLVL